MTLTSRHSTVLQHIPQAEPSLEELAAIARQAAHYVGGGQCEEALACYQQALLMDDTRSELWFNYANLQRAMGMSLDAVESFEFALRIRPSLYAARYCLAKLLFEMGQPLAAKAHYEEIVRESPGFVPAWRNLAQLVFALGDYERAQFCVQQAISRAPNDLDLQRMFTEMNEKGGKPNEPAAQN